MYGLINHIIEQLVLRKFGPETWELVRKEVGDLTPETFSIFERYDDASSYDLVFAAEKLLGVPAAKILELFGEFFFEYCTEIGYDSIMRALGGTPVDFLEQLDALHDHLSTTYSGFNAPSFRCTQEEDGNGTEFYLYYYSQRPALGPVVVGIIRAAFKTLFDVIVDIKVSEQETHEGEVCFLIRISDQEDQSKPHRLGSSTNLPRQASTTKEHLNLQSFDSLFPFHIVFNREMVVTSCGNAVGRHFDMHGLVGRRADTVFDIVRPRLKFNFNSILSHINTVYVLIEKDATSVKPLKLKGKMTFQWQFNVMMFFCSPSAIDLQDLLDQGVYLADIPIHDATKDLLLLSEQFAMDYQYARQLETMTNVLQTRYLELEDEKQKTDSLVYSVVPASIADDLRHKRNVPSLRYDDVTVLFSAIEGFSEFCATHRPIEIVQLLNTCHSVFDTILNPNSHPKVYKVETIADHYVVVSGCPQIVPDHAMAISQLALDLFDACDTALKITLGIHSGEMVAGIIGNRMPRYCLFGDTINTTSRTASCGKKGCINITKGTYSRLQAVPEVFETLQFQFYKEVQMKGKPKPVPVWLLSRKRNKSFSKAVYRWKKFGPKKTEHCSVVRISSTTMSVEKPETYHAMFAKSNGSPFGCPQKKSNICTLL